MCSKNFQRVAFLGCTVLLFFSSARAQPGIGGIANATYGIGGVQVNVTQRVQSLVRNGYLSFKVTNQELGVNDPAPGKVKELRIDVREWNGNIRTYTFHEWNQVNLQVSGGNNGWQGRLSREDQRNFDSLYSRWLQYTRQNQKVQAAQMERQMRAIYIRYQIPQNTPFAQVAANNIGPMPPDIPGSTWKGDPIATCINAVRSKIMQDFGNRVNVSLPAGSARVGSVSVGQIMIPVNGSGQFTPFNQPRTSTQYSCEIDKRFGKVSSVNYSRPPVTPQPR